MSTYTPKIKPKKADEDVPFRKKGKSWLSRFNAWLHLWPSIVSGIIVVFVCLTGTIIVYGDEIMEWTAGDGRYVKEVQAKRATSDELAAAVKAYNPTMFVSEIVFFKDPKRTVRIRTFNPKERKVGMMYLDPYTAEVLKSDNTIYFFFVTAHLHASLLAGEAGHWIVTISTIIFVISCITGLILWWPKRWTKKTFKDSFTVKWKARFKRLNYDLHNVYGFYSLILCLILGLTGLIIFFHPLADFTLKMAGASTEHMELPPAIEGKEALDMVPIVYNLFDGEYADKKNISIWANGLDKVGAYTFAAGTTGLKSTENLAVIVVDKYTGERIAVEKKYEKHETVENVVWQLHMGQWWGQFGKLSTFLAGIIATSLPITGFIIWWGKRKKKPKRSTKETKN